MIFKTQNPPEMPPWGNIVEHVQPLPFTPIYVVETPGESGGYMVEAEWGIRNLTEVTRRFGHVFHDGFQHWFCYEDRIEWAILMWDYAPLWDSAMAVRIDEGCTDELTTELEHPLKVTFPDFLPAYFKQFKESGDVV